jgi:ribonuclease Z
MTTFVGSKHWLGAIGCLLLVGTCSSKDRGPAVCAGTSGGQASQGGTGGGLGGGGSSTTGSAGTGASTTGSAGTGGSAAGTNGCGGDGQGGGSSGSSGAMTVTLLGTGSPIPSADRYGNSTLVEVPGLRLVFDIGRGAPIRLWQRQIPLGTINAHFVTHLHSDHVNGLPDLWMSGWIQTPFGSRKTPFLIFGPSGTEQMTAKLWEAFAEDRRIRLADEMNPIEGIQIEAHDVGPGLVFCQAGVSVWTFDVDHGELVKPARGYKISYAGHTVVLSGDTRYSTNVEQAATGADLLIHEVAMIPTALLEKYPAYQAILAHHISPEDAGRLFAVARPKLAAYSHIVLSGLPSEGIPFPTPADLLAATRTTYDGPIVVGSDLMAFKIDDGGVSMITGTGGGGAGGSGGGSTGGVSGAGGATGGGSGAGGPKGGAGGG